jgi:hypothetical protein
MRSRVEVQVLFLTSQRLLTEHWPAASALLEPVLQYVRGDFTLADLEDLCRDGRAVAGLVFEQGVPVLAMVFEFRCYPRKTTINVIALAGHGLERVASTFWPRFRGWALESGAAEIEACAHPAMTRMLRPLGFEHTYNLVRVAP